MKWIEIVTLLVVLFLKLSNPVFAQIPLQAQSYIRTLKNDPQFKHAHIGLCFSNVSTGDIVSSYNAEEMFIPASALKTITAMYALEKLGDTSQYRTTVYYEDRPDKIELLIQPSGDPTLGSHRFASTQPDTIWKKVYIGLHNIVDSKPVFFPIIPLGKDYMIPINDGWLWGDIANYYAAPAMPFNWRENFYMLHFSTAATEGASVELMNSSCADSLYFDNKVTSTYLNNTDEAYIYYDLNNPKKRIIKGTLPAGLKDFTVKGVDASPPLTFSSDGYKYLKTKLTNTQWNNNEDTMGKGMTLLVVITSPLLSDVVHQMLKHSINLYAEALVIKASQNKMDKNSAVGNLKTYCTAILKDSLSLILHDACGLSPLNRVTPMAMCHFLNYAENYSSKNKFHTYLNPLAGTTVPRSQGTYYIKDGYMTGVRSITGYYQNHFGVWYSFFISANDIQGDSSTAYYKMVKLLQLLID